MVLVGFSLVLHKNPYNRKLNNLERSHHLLFTALNVKYKTDVFADLFLDFVLLKASYRWGIFITFYVYRKSRNE